MEKTKQCEELIRQVEELGEEKTKLELELKNYVDEDKQKDKQLFEQQLKLITYEDQLTQNYTDRSKFIRPKRVVVSLEREVKSFGEYCPFLFSGYLCESSNL